VLKWHRVLKGEVPNEELTTLQADEKNTFDEIERLKKQLTEVLARQNERAKQFVKRFNDIVQRAITPQFKGTIRIDDEEMSFRIIREKSLGGEAYETLAVLLADLAILMESSSSSVCHPGFLIHDSPREADLNVKLYERMLDVAHSLVGAGGDDLPYQYIVSTTTKPSTPLRKASITKVTLSSGDGSLFKKQLEVASAEDAQKKLFDEADEQ
jgi:hypothetical protein